MKNLIILLLFAAFFAGCDADTPARESSTETVMERDNEPEISPDNDPGAVLDATVAAVESKDGDLTALPAEIAAANIDQWLDGLDDVDGAEKITGNLERLRNELTSGDINGDLAGMLLLTLSEDTKQVVGGRGNGATNTLISVLRSAGQKLTGDSYTGGGLLDQTLAAVRDKMGDITTLPVDIAVSNIDSWINKLSSMDGTDTMVEDLREMKTELKKPSIDGEAVAGRLKSLSDATKSLANGNQALEVLAYALEAGYWRLSEK